MSATQREASKATSQPPGNENVNREFSPAFSFPLNSPKFKHPSSKLCYAEVKCLELYRCNYINFRRNMVCLKCDHKRPNASITSTQFEDDDGDYINHDASGFRSGGCEGNIGKSAGQDGKQCKGEDMWRFVRDENEDEECSDSWTENSKFIDFSLLEIRLLSFKTEVKWKWELEMSKRSKSLTRIMQNDESKCSDSQRKLELLESSDDEEMPGWFRRR
ncbi:hypothetical protein CRYUN_Cryun04dG0174200 [Craigia yunnanensis]